MRSTHFLRSRHLASFVTFLLMLLLPCPCFGYGNLQFKDDHDNTVNSLWDERFYDSDLFPDGIPWLLNNWDPNSVIDANLADFQAIVNDSFETWEAVPETNIAFTYGGLTDNNSLGDGHGLPPNPALDGDNVIVFDELDPYVLGQTFIFTLSDEFTFDSNDADPNNDPNFGGTDPNLDIPEGTYPAGTILDADIMLNKNFPEWSVTGEYGKYDLQAVLVHEIGHFIGLCHSCVRETFISQAIMFPYAAPNPDGLEQRTLAQDDIAGVSSYYPSTLFYTNFGSISGAVTKAGSSHCGAHVWAVKNDDRSVIVGVYSDESGNYSIYGLPASEYVLRVEPTCFGKEKINEIVMQQPDDMLMNFMPQIYPDVNSENFATVLTVSAGAEVSGKNFALLPAPLEDTFEPDDSKERTRVVLSDGNHELHNFYPDGDTDWFRFTAMEGATYRLFVSNRAFISNWFFLHRKFDDPVMILFGEDGSIALRKNDHLCKSALRYEPCIFFTADKDGTYFVKVQGSTVTHSQARQYDFSVSQLVPGHVYVDVNEGSDEFGDGTRASPWASIQYAIDSVNGTLDKPQFIHIAEGIYYENVVCDPFEWLFGGYGAGIWERNPAVHTTIIDGNGIGSVVRAANMTEIDGLSITGGASTNGGGIFCPTEAVVNIIGNSIFDNSASGCGGGIYLDEFAGGFIEKNTIIRNDALEGGGLYSHFGPRGLTISDNVFKENVGSCAAHCGWGPQEDLDILGNRFLGNTGVGLGLRWSLSDTEIRDNVFVQNSGGVHFAEGDGLPPSRGYISNNLFCQNSGYRGGALELMGIGGCIEANIFVGNSTNWGGALYDYIGCPGIIANNIMVGNEAKYRGGAIHFGGHAVTPYVINNTIVWNRAGLKGGAFEFRSPGNYPFISNNIIAYNNPDAVYEENPEADPDFLHNNLPTTGLPLYYDDDTAKYYYTVDEINTEVNNPGHVVANNVGWDPGFKLAPSGTGDSIVYDANTFQSVLTDSNASFEPNGLATLTINPDVNQPLHFYIISNTETTITTWGDMTAVATPPCTYQVFDYHLAKDSRNINAGMDVSAYVRTNPACLRWRPDIDGDKRPLYDAFDIGADEVFPIAGDFEPDGDIDFADLKELVDHWLQEEPSVDIAPLPTGDGIVNFKDIALLAEHWLQGTTP